MRTPSLAMLVGSSLDLFAGPGGWDEGVRALGIEPLGVEWDDAACATRRAAGHPTLQADVSELDPADFAPCELLLASPPCQSFSVAGRGSGRASIDDLLTLASYLANGEDLRELAADFVDDSRSLLVVEPLRFALELRPKWVAFEQVPTVLPIWEAFAGHLRAVGYSTWTGKVSSEEYGVPQVRKRAILLASLEGPVDPPRPTHQAYSKKPLESDLPRWVSMCDAIGWGFKDRPSMSLVSASGAGGPRLLDGGSGSWAGIVKAWEEGRWVRAPHRLGEPFNRGDLSTCPVADGAVLQSFPRDYPWQGTTTSACQQIGNAVPPLMARALVAGLTGASAIKQEEAA